MQGYWQRPDETRLVLSADGWLRTGDIGAFDAAGFLKILDRKKDMLNRGGHKIYTAEVEAVLASHEDVIESAVIGRPCPVLGERVHAYVVTQTSEVEAETLRLYLAERLSDYKVPESFTFSADPLPRNAGGKILKRLLRERIA